MGLHKLVDPVFLSSQFELLKEYRRRGAEAGVRDGEEVFLSQPVVVDASIHAAIVLFEACHNIAKHLIASFGWRNAETKGETFRILTEQGVVSAETAEVFAKIGAFCNKVVYEAAFVDKREVYRILSTRLGDFQSFATQVGGWIKESNPEAKV